MSVEETTDELTTLRARVRDLEAILQQDDPSYSVIFHMRPTLAKVMGLLMSVNVVTSEMIHQRLAIVTDAKVLMHRLREHLKKYDIEVHSKRRVGYWLDKETKDRVRQQMADSL